MFSQKLKEKDHIHSLDILHHMRNPVKRHYRPTIEEQRQLTLRTNLSFKKNTGTHN